MSEGTDNPETMCCKVSVHIGYLLRNSSEGIDNFSQMVVNTLCSCPSEHWIQYGAFNREYCIIYKYIFKRVAHEQTKRLWRAVYAPGDGQTSPAYSSHSVQYLCINQLVSVNKQVLSYLLSCLLPQWWPQSGCTLCIVHCTIVHSHSHTGSHQRQSLSLSPS